MKKEEKSFRIPQIKKKINAFLVGEEGKISKASLLKGGVILSLIALSPILSSKAASAQTSHSNDLSLNYQSGSATGVHNHHGSHSSHSAHSAHSAHSSHDSHSNHASW